MAEEGQEMLGYTQTRVQWLSTRADKRKRVAQHGPHTIHTPVHTSSVRVGTAQGHAPMVSTWLMKGQEMLGYTQARVQWVSTRAGKRKRVARHGPHTVHTPVHTSSVRISMSRDTSTWCPHG
ncbi:hypothetical protein CYMTET_16994 [Cymbomonas tetramitiformis]|uniref:Uncharacterized protein n=1 Tax=Cymbomonas tetramitiformis TaxID=36881 RepID=A0AAE0GAU5_9CHLO|nr:hypothetical protein CYMTET_16994 [Cymbomonas tetramitiformis]